MEAFNQRQGFLVSAIVHLTLIMILASRPASKAQPTGPQSLSPQERRQAVFLPPPEVLRQLAAKPVPPPRPVPVKPPPPTPAPAPGAKDKISIGPPMAERAKGPLLLRREDNLTAVPKGSPSVAPPPADPPAAASPEQAGGAPETRTAEGLRLPPGLGRQASGAGGSRGRPGPSGPSITSSLRNLERRIQEARDLGLPSGTGQQMGPLFFDPEGADFTAWMQRFKEEVYHNWIIPYAALLNIRDHVDLEFTVERSGSISNLVLVKSAGNPALDRAARNALLGARFLPLPADYAPPRVTMKVSFYYNELPQGS